MTKRITVLILAWILIFPGNLLYSKSKRKTKKSVVSPSKKAEQNNKKVEDKQGTAKASESEKKFDDFSIRSGGGLGKLDTGLSVNIGFPRIDFNYYFLYNDKLEIAPEFSLFYGLGQSVPIIGTSLGARLKLKFFHKDKLTLFLYGEPALMLFFDPDVAFGIKIGSPGVIAKYFVFENGIVTGGIKLLPTLVFGSSFMFSFPMVLNLGAEFKVHKEFNVFYEMDIGPDIRKVAGSRAKTYLYITSFFGIAKKF